MAESLIRIVVKLFVKCEVNCSRHVRTRLDVLVALAVVGQQNATHETGNVIAAFVDLARTECFETELVRCIRHDPWCCVG